MEIGEEKELAMVSSEADLPQSVLAWLNEVMAGQDFIFCMGGFSYMFTWDLPHMVHRVARGFQEAYDSTTENGIVYPRLEGKSVWGKLTVRRVL